MYPTNMADQGGKTAGPLEVRRKDITLRQNIDAKIEQAKKHLAELEAAKERMKMSGLLDMRIEDITHAMSW